MTDFSYLTPDLYVTKPSPKRVYPMRGDRPGGNGMIAGNIAGLPVEKVVWVLVHDTKQIVGQVTLGASDTAYLFTGLDPTAYYDILAQDLNKTREILVQSRVLPYVT